MVLLPTLLLAAFAVLNHFSNVFAAPSNVSLEVRAPHAAAPPPPHFAVYSDEFVSGEFGPPSPSKIKGFNVFYISFLLVSGPADQAEAWAELSASQRSNIRNQYHNAGIKLMVSAFGATDAPTSTRKNPTTVARNMASWVKTFGLDGIDVDYEDFDAFDAGTAVNWLLTYTKVLRQELPASQYIITHAPIAPWFSPSLLGGPYLTVNSQVGSMIDWYNVQFYNQEKSYTTCNGVVKNSGGPYTKSSIFEIAASGVPLNKIVLGKPATARDADQGFMSPSTLATCVQQAKNSGWQGGVMVWEYPRGSASWIKTVRSKSFPV